MPFLKFNIYHNIKFWLGHEQQHPLSSNTYDTVYAKPSCFDTCGELVPSRFDIVLLNKGYAKTLNFHDNCIAQVRAIFSISPCYLKSLYKSLHNIPPYYAYLEWFDPFDNIPHPFYGLYTVRHTFKNGHKVAVILPIGHIQRSAHLFPAFDSNDKGEVWKCSTVLDKCSTFYLNCFSDRHAYHYFV